MENMTKFKDLPIWKFELALGDIHVLNKMSQHRQALSWCNKLNVAQSMTRSNNWIYGFQCPDPEHPIAS